MPTLDQILGQTMLALADPELLKRPSLGASASVTAADPTMPINPPTAAPDGTQRRRAPVWSWQHDGSTPGSVTQVKSRVLGMGMNYNMAMPVCDEITLQDVSITLPNGDVYDSLPLTSTYVIRKYKSEGYIAAGRSDLFPLEAFVDQSLLVVFGYRLVSGGNRPAPNQTRNPYAPLTEAELKASDFMPEISGDWNIACKTGELQACLLREYKIIVCFSLTCCKENNDFEPGCVLGANRIFPHCLVMSNMTLKQAKANIRVIRPATSAHEMADMNSDLGPIFFTDTNLPPGQTAGPPLPFWDNMFDYYETDPSNIHGPLQMVDSDPASARSQPRRQNNMVQKLTGYTPPAHVPSDSFVTTNKESYQSLSLLKMPRQGDFDNMHIAPKMKISFAAYTTAADPTLWRLKRIAMAPFCVHDCLHTHVRWGTKAHIWASSNGPMPATAMGFDTNFKPYCVMGAPQVPHNQSVTWTLVPPAGFTYTGTILFDFKPGMWHVVFHHGMAYANDLWARGTVWAARQTTESTAVSVNGEKEFPPLTATNSWALFYWRLRYGGNSPYSSLNGELKAPEERVVADVPACMKL